MTGPAPTRRDSGNAWLPRRAPVPAWVRNATPHIENPALEADIPNCQRRSLLELDRHTCRWPVGDPATAAFFFCGAPPVAGKAYCARHRARALLPRLGGAGNANVSSHVAEQEESAGEDPETTGEETDTDCR